MRTIKALGTKASRAIVLVLAAITLVSCGKTAEEAALVPDEDLSRTDAWVIVEERGGIGADGPTYTYTSTLDEHGNVVSMTGEGLTETREFDDDGYCTQLVTTFVGVEGSEDDVTTTTYSYEKDDQGRAKSQRSSSGLVTTYTYDDEGRITTTESGYAGQSDGGELRDKALRQVSTFTYDADGMATRVRHEYGETVLVDEYSYEGGSDARHPKTVTIREHQETPKGDLIEGSEQTKVYTVTYDDDGNYTCVEGKAGGQQTVVEYSWQHVEDASLAVRTESRLRRF